MLGPGVDGEPDQPPKPGMPPPDGGGSNGGGATAATGGDGGSASSETSDMGVPGLDSGVDAPESPPVSSSRRSLSAAFMFAARASPSECTLT